MTLEIQRGDIWYINQGGQSAIGSEQKSGRPAIVVSNNLNNRYSKTIEVVYLTTHPKTEIPNHVTIQSSKFYSTALCEQVTSVSTQRLGRYCGHLTAQEMRAVDTALMISLGLTATRRVCV